MKVTINQLVQSGALVVGDGYRTNRREHGTPGFRIIRVADVQDGRVRLESPDFVNGDRRPQIGAKLGKPGDVLLTTKGTVGRVAVLPRLDEEVVYSPQLCFFRVLPNNVLDREYLRYWFESVEFWAQAGDRMNNTDMAAYINLADIRSLRLSLPTLESQRDVSAAIRTLDDKIATNRRLLGVLQSLAVREFEHSVYTSPRTVPLAEISVFHNHLRRPLSAVERADRPGRVPYYGATGVFGYVNDALFDSELLLIGEDGSVVTDAGLPFVQYIWGPSWINNHAHVLTGSGVSTELLYLAMSRAKVGELVTGAVQPKLSMGNLKRLHVSIPSGDVLGRLEGRLAHWFSLYRARSAETAVLTELRGTLLPALMSGRLRVRDAERAIEAVV